MQLLRSFRAFRIADFRKKDLLFAALVLFVGAGAIAGSLPDPTRFAGSLLFAGLLAAAVLYRKKRKTAYSLSGLALLVFVAVVQAGDMFAGLMIAYPLLLFYALLLPNPLYTLAAALAVGLNLYAFTDLNETNEWMAHLFFIALNATAYTTLAYYTRKLEKERNEYRHLSTIDSLTGLASLQQTLLFGQRLIEEGRRVKVLLIDLNFFKQINDTYGHMIGNKVILFVADYLRQLIKGGNGIAGRLGGDEFVLVVEDSPRFANIREKLTEELNGRSFVPEEGAPPISLSFSVGISDCSSGARPNIEELLHQADLHMYEFKLHHRLPILHGKTADLIEHNPDPICTFDRKGKLLAVNPAACKLLGHSAEEMTGRTFLALIHPQDRLTALSNFQETLKGTSNRFDLRLQHQDGRTITVEVTHIPIIADHEIVGIYGVAKDVSDLRKTEELLRSSDRLAVMGQLAAGLAHDIRNPLTALKGFIQLLQSSSFDHKSYFPIMLNELERINYILNEFLLLGKPHASSFRETDIREVVSQVAALLDSQAILNKVRIVVEEEPGLPAVQCDENQLKQVVVNLLKNAIESMPDGGNATVRIGRTSDGVSILVADEGGGIPEKLLPRLGEPFFTTKEKGNGLGLTVCRKIMDHHGGKLLFRSVEGAGTTAEAVLPFREIRKKGVY